MKTRTCGADRWFAAWHSPDTVARSLPTADRPGSSCPSDQQAAKLAEAEGYVDAALACGLMGYGEDPTEPQDAQTCTHPGAYVYAEAGVRSESEESEAAPAVVWRPLPDNDGGRRPGERLSASLGECSACGSLVGQLTTWHPDDAWAGRAYGSRWVGLYEAGPRDEPVLADLSAQPVREYVVDANPDDLTDEGTERIARVRSYLPDGGDMTVAYRAGDGARDAEQCLVTELDRHGLRTRRLTRREDGGFTVSVTQ